MMKKESKFSHYPITTVATRLSMSIAENLLDMKNALNSSSQLDLNKELVCLFVGPSFYLMQGPRQHGFDGFG